MLTGDNASTARAIAAQAGIEDARGDLLPEDKQTAIQDSQRTLGMTAMVGDGINDAPSLAQSDIGSRWAVPAPTWRWKRPTWSS